MLLCVFRAVVCLFRGWRWCREQHSMARPIKKINCVSPGGSGHVPFRRTGGLKALVDGSTDVPSPRCCSSSVCVYPVLPRPRNRPRASYEVTLLLLFVPCSLWTYRSAPLVPFLACSLCVSWRTFGAVSVR